METGELTRALKHIRGFQGVFALDHLPHDNKEIPALYVVNTDPSCEEGEHWVAIYFPPHGTPEFFDSFGRKAFATELRRLLGNVYRHNRQILQSPWSDTCGQHIIYYANQRHRGISFENIPYQRSLSANDRFVQDYAETQKKEKKEK